MTIFYIAAGGAIGAVMRHFVVNYAARAFGSHFPFGTMMVNVAGSFIMGVIISYFAATEGHSNDLRLFTAVGVLGGFTTFSAFSIDAATLIKRGEILSAIIYITASVAMSLAALFTGMFVIRELS